MENIPQCGSTLAKSALAFVSIAILSFLVKLNAQAPDVLLKRTNGVVLISRPALGDNGHFYAAGIRTNAVTGAGVVAVDSTTLTLLWGPITACSGNNFATDGVSVGANGIIYSVGDWNNCHDGRLLALNADGSTAWLYTDNPSPHPRQTPALDDQRQMVIFGSYVIQGLDYNTHTVRWSSTTGLGIGQRGIGVDAVGNTFVGSHSGGPIASKVSSLNITGGERWEKTFRGSQEYAHILGIADNNTILIYDSVGISLRALSTTDGSEMWQVSNMRNPVTDQGGNIYVSSVQYNIIMSLTPNGSQRWWRYLGASPSILLDFVDNTGRLYVRGDRTLFAVDPTNGSVVWQFQADAALTVPTALNRDGQIYLCDAAGTSYLLDTALDYASSTWPVANFGNRRHTQKSNDRLSLPSPCPDNLTVRNLNCPSVGYLSDASIAVSCQVCNTGPDYTRASRARIRLSADSVFSSTDFLSPSILELPALGPGACSNVTGSFSLNTQPGRYYVGLILEANYPTPEITCDQHIAISSNRFSLISNTSSTISVSPTNRYVDRGLGLTSFTLANAGYGALNWTASAKSNAWLTFLSDSNGTLAFTSEVNLWIKYDGNPTAVSRTGVVQIVPDGILERSVNLAIIQEATKVLPSTFMFSSLGGTQYVNTPFSAVITAVRAALSQPGNASASPALAPETRFSGWVDLQASSGAHVVPSKIRMQNGQWSGMLSLDSPSSPTSLIAQNSGIRGISESFALKLLNLLTVPSVVRVVAGDHKIPVRDAIVRVFNFDLTYDQQLSGANDGRYMFSNLVPGDYQISVKTIGSIGECLQSVHFDGYAREVTVAVRSGKRPVLFVAGFLGSTLMTSKRFFAELSGEVNPLPPDELRLFDINLSNPLKYVHFPGWATLRKSLSENYEVFDVPWDWRVPAIRARNGEVAWLKYLLPKIEEAKCKTGSSTVDVVAHSTGGLLTRAYIQSPLYEGRHDINKFAMVGVPNLGAAVGYYLWEGGDFEKIKQLDPESGNFYYNTAEDLYQKTYKGRHWATIGQLDRRNFVQHFIPSAGELLPIFDFLKRPDFRPSVGSLDCLNYDYSFDYETSSLFELNNQQLDRFYTTPYDLDNNGKVRTKVFLSRHTPTLTLIPAAGCRLDGLYPNGEPYGNPYSPSEGDGTVWYKSALMQDRCAGNSTFEYDDLIDCRHSELVGKYADKIKAFLDGEAQASRALVPHAAIPPDEVPRDYLAISAVGRVQPELTDPFGNVSGVNIFTGTYSNNIPNTEVSASILGNLIMCDSPLDGQYEYSFRGLVGNEVVLTVAYASTNGYLEETIRWIGTDRIISTRFSIDRAVLRIPSVLSPLKPPQGVRTEGSETVRLSWLPAEGTNVVGYKVYGRREDLPRFELLTTTTSASVETGHSWANVNSGTNWSYSVVSITAEGEESWFTNTVNNEARLFADFDAVTLVGNPPLNVAFRDQSLGAITTRTWDFDGDGNVDSTELSPSVVYTQPGVYSVTLVINGPEGTRTVTKAGYVTVGNQNLQAIFGSVSRLSNGDFHLPITNAANRDLFIETSANLETWSLFRILRPTNGVVQSLQVSSTDARVRFYRAVVP